MRLKVKMSLSYFIKDEMLKRVLQVTQNHKRYLSSMYWKY